MDYKRMKEQIFAQNKFPYSKLINIRKNPEYANFICDSFAGPKGEFTAVAQYVYEHISSQDQEGLNELLLSIAIQEMGHLNKLGGLIKILGGNPIFKGSKENIWTAKNIRFEFNNIHEMMSYNVESEIKAIEAYRRAISYTRNRSIQEYLSRIILDEKVHLKIFETIRDNA